jgi:hypothetical protein
MPLARPYSSKPSSRQTRIVSWVFLPRKAKVVHSSDGGGLAGVGVPNKNRFGHAVQVSTPRVHCCTFSSIGKVDLVPRSRREQDYQHPGAETPRHSYHLAVATPIPCGRRERDAESAPVSDQPARFSPDHVFPRDSRSYRKGNSCS